MKIISYIFILIFILLFQSNIYSQLVWSTYLGGENNDVIRNMSLDSSFNIILVGNTMSSNFPVTDGAYNKIFNFQMSDNSNMFITKLDLNASNIIFSTFIALGSISSLEIDKNNNLNFTGGTYHNDYPTSPFAYKTTGNNNTSNVIATKINSIGTSLLYSTYIGDGNGAMLDLDSYGNIIICGGTVSKKFPITIGAYDTANNGQYDAFVTKMNRTFYSLIYSTYLGGSNNDESGVIKIDNNGNTLCEGYTESNDFPVTKNAFDSIYKNAHEIFITKLNSTGDSLIYSTFIGGSKRQGSNSLVFDKYNNSHICGFTLSNDFPITSGAYNSNIPKYSNSFVSKLNQAGDSLIFSTFIGDSSVGYDIALDYDCNIYLTGSTNSNNFLITSDAYNKSFNSVDSINHIITYDCYLTILNHFGNSLIYSSFLGGRSSDAGSLIKLDSLNNIYVAGQTQSTNFPVTDGVFQKKYKGNSDIFVSKFNFCDGSPDIHTTDSIKFPYQLCQSQAQDTSVVIYNTGNCKLSVSAFSFTGDLMDEFSVLEPNYIPFYIQENDSILLKIRFTPKYETGTKKSTLSLLNNTSVNPYFINLSASKDSIAFNVNNQESDTIEVDFGTICPGVKDTTITIFNKSSIGTTFKIENKDPQLQIVPVGKAGKKEEDTPKK
jgi:hypothetical protein